MRFTIRDVMLLTIIVAVCTAWWLDRTKLQRENYLLKKKSQEIRQNVIYSGTFTGRLNGLPLGEY